MNSVKSQIKLSNAVQKLLRCPVCYTKLEIHSEHCRCENHECNFLFPMINKIPILIDENSSLFSIDDFVNRRHTFFDLSPSNNLKKTLKKFLPNKGKNIKGKENYGKFAELLLNKSINPKVLVIGGSILGDGMEVILENPNIELVESDISFGPRTSLICDAHTLPFEDNSFDGVIVQAVLEHVVDPFRCVDEIHRILKEDGLVYSEMPFMQQVHGGCYDFTRFTYLGHRRLFRKFKEIGSGVLCGPGMALAWSYEYFLLSFTKSMFIRTLVRIFVRITAFYLKYLDYLLIERAETLDAASAYYFIGTKSNQILPDKELIKLYKGTQ